MDSIIANFKTQMSAVIAEEMEKTLGRLRDKIFEAIDVSEDDQPEIDLNKFATNTVKKIMENEIFSKTDEEIKKISLKSSSAKKEKKDPDAPKASVNAYIMFCREKRDEVKEENKEMKATEITKKLAEMWNEMDDEDKEEYKEKAKEDKERYAKELENYEPKEGFKNPKEKAEKKSKKESNSPKRGLSAYIFFCQDKREEVKKNNPSLKATEILSELGKMWKSLTDKKKKPYEEKAKEDKVRYEEEMKNYEPEEKEEKKKTVKKSSPRSPSAYLLFCKDKRDEVKNKNPEMKMTEITSELGNMWSNMSDAKKKKYVDQAAKLKKEFEDKKEESKSEEDVEDVEDVEVEKSPKKANPKKVAQSSEEKEVKKTKKIAKKMEEEEDLIPQTVEEVKKKIEKKEEEEEEDLIPQTFEEVKKSSRKVENSIKNKSKNKK
jgi:hypothetical protein